MELLKSPHHRSRLSELAYIVMNVAAAVTILVLIVQFNNVWLSLLVVLLSKWRVFAVRPRYWMANLTANVVDIVVGVSHVLFVYSAAGALYAQIFMTVGYIVWLLFVKPRSKRIFVIAQAIAAVFVGTNALALVAYDSDPGVFVLGLWLLGFAAARHILLSYEGEMVGFFGAVWGLILAEVGWVAYHWQMAYSLPGTGNFKLVQLAFITALLTFLASRAYASYHKHGVIRTSDTMIPMVFTFGIIFLMIVLFNQPRLGL